MPDLLEHHHDHAPVLRASLAGFVRRRGKRVTVGDGRHAVQWNAGLTRQVASNGVGAALTEVIVVARAAGVVAAMGDARAIVLRGNGAVVVGTSLQEACVMAWYLEDAARVELDVLSSGETGVVFSDAEAADRATLQGRIIERMWDWLTRDEPRA